MHQARANCWWGDPPHPALLPAHTLCFRPVGSVRILAQAQRAPPQSRAQRTRNLRSASHGIAHAHARTHARTHTHPLPSAFGSDGRCPAHVSSCTAQGAVHAARVSRPSPQGAASVSFASVSFGRRYPRRPAHPGGTPACQARTAALRPSELRPSAPSPHKEKSPPVGQPQGDPHPTRETACQARSAAPASPRPYPGRVSLPSTQRRSHLQSTARRLVVGRSRSLPRARSPQIGDSPPANAAEGDSLPSTHSCPPSGASPRRVTPASC